MKSKLLINNNSKELIIFMSGWGCDDKQFAGITTSKDLVIFYDYDDLKIDFDFSRYQNFYLIAYSAGVFVTTLIIDKLPKVELKVAINGNINLFDENLGLDDNILKVFRSIDVTNFLEFREKYLCKTLEELEIFKSRFIYDRMLLSDSDMIFKFKFQKEYYTSLNKTKLYLIKNANHNVFSMHITDFDKVIECNSELYTYRLN